MGMVICLREWFERIDLRGASLLDAYDWKADNDPERPLDPVHDPLSLKSESRKINLYETN